MRRILTGLVAILITVVMNVEAHALVFPLAPGDSLSVYGMFACAKWMPCEGGRLYEFFVTEPAAFETSVTLTNFTDVTFRLFPASSPGAPLGEWFASSPGTVTPLTLNYPALLPDTVYNFSVFGSVPMTPRTLVLGGFEGTLHASSMPVASAPVSVVPLPGAIWLFGSGLAMMFLGYGRRR
jgi:hypothetical protein